MVTERVTNRRYLSSAMNVRISRITSEHGPDERVIRARQPHDPHVAADVETHRAIPVWTRSTARMTAASRIMPVGLDTALMKKSY